MTLEERYSNQAFNLFQDRRRKRSRINSKSDYQLDWIKGIQDQIAFSNNPDVLPDYVLYLKIARRWSEP
jgi:hypothetical protein